MIVVAIIGILAAIAIPTYQSHLAETEAATNHLECSNAVKAANLKRLTTSTHTMAETSFGTTSAYKATLIDGTYGCVSASATQDVSQDLWMCDGTEESPTIITCWETSSDESMCSSQEYVSSGNKPSPADDLTDDGIYMNCYNWCNKSNNINNSLSFCSRCYNQDYKDIRGDTHEFVDGICKCQYMCEVRD